MINCVHGGHVGEQSLGSANVAGRLFTTNVLLPSLERQTVSLLAIGILGDSDKTSRHPALVFVAASKKGGMGTAVTHGNTEALGAADGNVDAEFSRRLNQSESKEIRDANGKSTGFVSAGNETFVVGDGAVGVGVLDQ